MSQDVAHTGDLDPRNLRPLTANLGRQRLDRLANNDQVVGDGIECDRLERSITTRLCVLEQSGCGKCVVARPDDVGQPIPQSSCHRGTASRLAARATAPRSRSSGATSTGSPRTSSSAFFSSMMGPSPLDASKETSRSMSLSSSSSPRATEPKIRTLDAPAACAAARISRRCERTIAARGAERSAAGAGSVPNCRLKPAARSRRSRVDTEGEATPASYRATAAWDVPARRASDAWVRPAASRAL